MQYKATRFLRIQSVESVETEKKKTDKNSAKKHVILWWFVVEY